ncbi:MAG: hypothetical protein C4533_00935 [Candidatus Omnitrophota bacterium]|jgi:rubrerythrin|nr:MAG: hypothetical protein C4533_00935 [Candidatus Omnitrophota bacterium]
MGIYAGSEVIEMGIQIERNGRDFYAGLANKSKNLSAKEIFKYLAEQEEQHIEVFKKLLASTTKLEPVPIYAQEYIDYMKLLASQYVFTENNTGMSLAKGINSDTEAVDLGIGFEKDSILLYEALKKAVTSKDLDIIDALISQEQEHLKTLISLKDKLKKGA